MKANQNLPERLLQWFPTLAQVHIYCDAKKHGKDVCASVEKAMLEAAKKLKGNMIFLYVPAAYFKHAD